MSTILVAGTASHVGKSTVAAGLCRLLADRGVAVAPFKAQNMSNNARAVPKSQGEGFGEIGVSQYVQARAARVSPETDHNPVLLKPRGEGESQLVLNGEAVGHYAAADYYEDHWAEARETALSAYDRLAERSEVIVAEGAGSIAEINLQHRDLANVELARHAESEVLLVADIERGGVFASLVGTLELLPEDLRERVVGCVITKFRGDRSLLDPGVEEFEARAGVPVLGVLPFDDPGLPEEDSVALPPEGERRVRGADDGIEDPDTVTVAVPRVPRISNFTDLEPLAATPGVRVAYLPLDDGLDGADAVVLPGTKNTVDDLRALRESGMAERLRAFEGPVVGLCGGYQFLGERVINAGIESVESGAECVEGLGLLPVETAFDPEKRVEATRLRVDGVGPLAGAHGTMAGYEIHMGETHAVEGAAELALPFARLDGEATAGLGAARANVLGTYLHGLFENERARAAFVERVFAGAQRERPAAERERRDPYDHAAALVRDHVDLDGVGALEAP